MYDDHIGGDIEDCISSFTSIHDALPSGIKKDTVRCLYIYLFCADEGRGSVSENISDADGKNMVPPIVV